MSLLKYKKNVLAAFMVTSTLALSGCVWSSQTQPVETSSPAVAPTPAQPATSQTYAAPPKYIESDNGGVDAQKLGLTPQSTCIKQLDSLKTFSPSDYQSMMSSFKEISEINAMYRSVFKIQPVKTA